MSYGYNTAVSPQNIGPYGFGYGGYGTGAGQATTLPAMTQANQAMPMQAMANQAMPMQAMANQPMPMQTMANQAMPMQAMGNQAAPLQAAANKIMPLQSMGNQPMKGGSAMSPAAVPSGAVVTPSGGNIVTMPAVEESYVENILRLNRGKMATFYMTYENNREWNAKIFKGVIEAAGRDHIIISDPTTGMRFLLLTLNLDYVTFDGPINYEYPFQGGVVTPSTPVGR